jgi:energy-coupling factor transporter ATP-binding protein EcfA2
MPNSPLIAKLHAHATLLPSQRELLERVIFQLEFNGFQHIHLVGKTGSGKTTLSLVLAELLSDDMLLAYFSAKPDMTTQDCQQQLLQQWFGLSDYESSLMQQLEQLPSQPLAWILDSQGDLPHSCLSMLRAHPVHIITTGPNVLTEADVNLTIPSITAADASQLLPESAISAWSVQERLEHAGDNLHRLLEPDTIPAESEESVVVQASGRSAMRYRLASLALAVVGGLVITAYWLMDSRHEPVKATAPAVDNRLAERFQAPVLHQQSALPQGAELVTESEDITQSSDTPSEQTSTQPDTAIASDSRPEDAAEELAAPSQEQPQVQPQALLSQYRYQEDELLAMDADAFSLQLGAFSTESIAQRLVSSYPELDMYLYQRKLGGQLQWVVVLAPFADAVSARNKRSQLPDALQADTPFAKPLSTLQQEIYQRETDDSGNL